MKGFWRVLLVMVCGALMALAALAGQVGYGDNYGRASLQDVSTGGEEADHYPARGGMTAVHFPREGVGTLW
jgi:hypothetical protein